MSMASPAASSIVWPSRRGVRRSVTRSRRVWPPEATRLTNGGSSATGASQLAAMCPWRWSTMISGLPAAYAIAFAVATPIRSAPISPGRCVTATASTSPRAMPACASASSTTPLTVPRWCRAATSGTTPP